MKRTEDIQEGAREINRKIASIFPLHHFSMPFRRERLRYFQIYGLSSFEN